ncbi:MAG: AAA family ATPase [Actinomycetota bacterium]|nr:AAA family ATPase [Actinomycetota bacterium]
MGVGGTLEREMERVAVTRLISGARAGQGGALFVVGEAGLGKTTILDQAKELACPDVRIGWGSGDAMEASLPFGLFATVLDTVDGPRDLLELPATGSRDSDVQAARFCRVLRWLEATATQPILIALDDLHWADQDSLALVSFLARRVRRLPVAVLGALRPWPPAAYELSAALAYDGYAAVARLAPLSRDAGAELLAARLAGPVSGAVSRTALELCGGNPLLLEQVAAAIGRGEDVGAPTRIGRAVSRPEIILTRFAGVPKTAIRCAQAASVLGTRFRPELAAAVAELNDREADIALDALCRSGLVHSKPETEMAAEFVHPLFRQALYEDLAVPVRTRLHRRAFAALTAWGLHGEAVDHAIRADLTGDDVAIRAMTRAGIAALRSGAPAMATRHLKAAVRAAGSRADADLLFALAEALLAVGRPSEAIAVCDQLRSEQELMPAQRVKVLRILGQAFSATGAHSDSTTCFVQAAELAEAHDPAVIIEVLLDAALASWMSAGPAKSLPLAKRAYTLAANAETWLSNRAASVWGYLAFLSGDPQGLIESEAGARAVEADALENPSALHWSWDALSTFSIAATFAERFNDAQRVLDMLVVAAERIDAAEAISGLAVTQAIVAARQGRLAEALGYAERANSSVNLSPAHVSHAGSIRAEVLHQIGRGAESMEWCDRIEPNATARGESYTLLRLWNIRGQYLLRDGRPDAASELYVQLEELSRRMGIGEPCWVPWARYAITAHLSACRAHDARRVIAWLDHSATRLPCRYPRIAAATGRASLAEAEGDYEAAEAHFSSALALHQQVPLPLEQVETLLGYGAFLRRRGRPCQARPLLAEATAIAEANQAGWLAEQVREELAVAGGRRRSRNEATRLTIQEQRVARLAAAGHSNKAIAGKLTLSVKTIEYHLQQIYMKLGISSRRQLMTGQHDGETSRVVSIS